MKKISVIVNCHNGERYLKKCISSILDQDYQNFEIIFFDNFSSDNSKNIIQDFNNEKIKYFYSDNKLSLYKARNEAIKKSSGFFIAFLDVDDWWDKNYLSSRKKFFDNNLYDYFYNNVSIFYENKNKFVRYKNYDLPDGKIYDFLVKDYFIIISGLIIKKSILEKENYFNEEYNIIGDYDLIMRISKYAFAKALNKPLIFYRVHKNNFSKLHDKMYFDEYNNWFNFQYNKNDLDFKKNKFFFLLKLNKLELIYLLYKKKNFSLLVKIIKLPHFGLKIKFLLAFLLPLKLINFFRK